MVQKSVFFKEILDAYYVSEGYLSVFDPMPICLFFGDCPIFLPRPWPGELFCDNHGKMFGTGKEQVKCVDGGAGLPYNVIWKKLRMRRTER